MRERHAPAAFSEADIARLHKFGKIAEGLVAAHDQAIRAAAAAREVAEKAQLLWKKNRLLQQVERIGKVGGWELDIEFNEVEWSDEVARIHELPVGKQYKLEEALSYYPEPWRSLVSDNVERTKATGKPYDFESQFVTPLGHKKWVRAAGDCEHHDGKPVRLFGMFQDVTLEKEASERLWQAANFDDLTSLPNRRHFNEALGSAIEHAGSSGTAVTLIMLDLDNFKEVNDTRGHAVGDKILAEMAAVLRASPLMQVSWHDWAEMSLLSLLPVIFPTKTSLKWANRFLPTSSHPFTLGRRTSISEVRSASRDFRLTRVVRLNCSGRPISPSTPPRKRVGDRYGSIRPNSTRFLSGMRAQLTWCAMHLSGGGSSRSTSRRCACTTAACVDLKRPARVLADDGSIVTPSAFAAALDDRVMARRIGKKMLHAVTTHIASWRDAGLEPQSVSLNVGEADFADGRLAHRVLQRLHELALPHSSLTIEVTESSYSWATVPHWRERHCRRSTSKALELSWTTSAPATPH